MTRVRLTGDYALETRCRHCGSAYADHITIVLSGYLATVGPFCPTSLFSPLDPRLEPQTLDPAVDPDRPAWLDRPADRPKGLDPDR